jgi:hypothetical protein
MKEETPEFNLFWKAYPKKKGKLPAKKAWDKLDPDGILVGVILLAIKRQSQSPDWLKDGGQFIPMPATWLNQRRWEDEVETKPLNPEDARMARLKAKAREMK